MSGLQPSRFRFHAGRRLAAIAALSLAVMLFAGAGGDSRFSRLGHMLMCRCGCNQVLLECNHVGCTYSDGMRKELLAGIQHGDSDQVIMAAFVQKYGPTVLAAPTTTGFDRLAWIMPFAALTGGLLLVGIVVRAWNTRRSAARSTPAADPAALDELRRRVHEETEI